MKISHLPKKAGIYKITCLASGKCYIGSAQSIRDRIGSHVTRLKGKYHHNPAVQNSWNKYGPELFIAEAVLICSVADLCMYEQAVVDAIKPEFNVRVVVESCRGVVRSEETRRKLSVALRGKMPPMSAERRKALSEWVKQNPVPRADPKAISRGKRAAGIGKKYSVCGEMLTPVEVAERFGVHRKTFVSRLEQGWSADDAARKPVRKGNYNGGHKQK
jgi:group I intron endonuclease